MLTISRAKCIILISLLCLLPYWVYAQALGQTIQITTRFNSFIGKPTWLLVIRDLDHDENIPYFYEIKRGDNFWVAFTYSRNYLITVSNLQIETYRSRYNKYKNYRIRNFCHLESNGRILRGESVFVTISGDLGPNPDGYTCQISRYKNSNFAVAPSDE